jgi:hypothetical protein
MREIRPSGSEGGVARKRHPYPYQALREAVSRRGTRETFGVRRIPALLGASADGRAELIIAPALRGGWRRDPSGKDKPVPRPSGPPPKNHPNW